MEIAVLCVSPISALLCNGDFGDQLGNTAYYTSQPNTVTTCDGLWSHGVYMYIQHKNDDSFHRLNLSHTNSAQSN